MQHTIQVSGMVLEAPQSLDSSNYQTLINQAQEAYRTGNKRIIIDFQHTDAISTFGLFALHTIISLFYNISHPTLESWLNSSHTMTKPSRTNAFSKLIFIRQPKPHIAQALYSIGFYDYAEIFVSA